MVEQSTMESISSPIKSDIILWLMRPIGNMAMISLEKKSILLAIAIR